MSWKFLLLFAFLASASCYDFFSSSDSIQNTFHDSIESESKDVISLLMEFVESDCPVAEAQERKILHKLDSIHQQVTSLIDSVRTSVNSRVRERAEIKTLGLSDKASLKDVFYGGQPHVVQCIRDYEQVHPLYEKTATKLLDLGVRPLALDCESPLPSGKTTREKFLASALEKIHAKDRKKERDEKKDGGKKKKKSKKDSTGDESESVERSLFFTVADGAPPKPFYVRNTLSDVDKLVDAVVKKTTPTITKLSETKEFKTQCTDRPECLIALNKGSLTEEQKSVLLPVAASHRGVSFGSIDDKRYKLTIEDILPDPPADDTPQLLYLAQGSAKKMKAKVFRGDFTTSEIEDFLVGVRSGETSVKSIKTPYLVARRKTSTAEPRKASDSDPSGPFPSEPSVDDVADSLSRERERREQMEAEAQRRREEEVGGADSTDTEWGDSEEDTVGTDDWQDESIEVIEFDDDDSEYY